MESELTNWVKTQLQKRHWSIRELARQSGISQPLISQVLSGKKAPSVNFCYRIAKALDELPETLMRLANILPSLPEGSDDSATIELTEIARTLPEDKRKQLLDFARFLRKQPP